MIGLPDEITIEANESIYIHDYVDQRAYVTKTTDSSSGFLPYFVIDFDNDDQLDESFNELALFEESVDQNSQPKSQELPRPKAEFIKMKPKLSSARRFAFRDSSTLSSPDENEATASHEERETEISSSRSNLQDDPPTSLSNGELASSQSRFEFGAASINSPEPETDNFLVRARKRQAHQMESSETLRYDVELNQHRATILRFSNSSRPTKHGSKPTLYYQYKGVNYKALWNSVSKKKCVFKCFDCKASTRMLVPEESITYYRDNQNRKRFVIKEDFNWSDELVIMSQDEHTCRGRSTDDLEVVYEKIINQYR